jgi:hypothetical protein
MDRTRLASLAAASLWAFLTFTYAPFVGLLAVLGLPPAIALVGWGRNRRVLQACVALGVVATLVGIGTFLGTTSDNRLELAGFVIVPVAAAIYSLVALRWLVDASSTTP